MKFTAEAEKKEHPSFCSKPECPVSFKPGCPAGFYFKPECPADDKKERYDEISREMKSQAAEEPREEGPKSQAEPAMDASVAPLQGSPLDNEKMGQGFQVASLRVYRPRFYNGPAQK